VFTELLPISQPLRSSGCTRYIIFSGETDSNTIMGGEHESFAIREKRCRYVVLNSDLRLSTCLEEEISYHRDKMYHHGTWFFIRSS
jgi:hypothetical protein